MRVCDQQKFEYFETEFRCQGTFENIRQERLRVINNWGQTGWQYVSEWVREHGVYGNNVVQTIELTFRREITELKAFIDERGRTSYEKA